MKLEQEFIGYSYKYDDPNEELTGGELPPDDDEDNNP